VLVLVQRNMLILSHSRTIVRFKPDFLTFMNKIHSLISIIVILVVVVIIPPLGARLATR